MQAQVLLGALGVAALAGLKPAVAEMERAADRKAGEDLSGKFPDGTQQRSVDDTAADGSDLLDCQQPGDGAVDGSRGHQQEEQSDGEDIAAEGAFISMLTSLASIIAVPSTIPSKHIAVVSRS